MTSASGNMPLDECGMPDLAVLVQHHHIFTTAGQMMMVSYLATYCCSSCQSCSTFSLSVCLQQLMHTKVLLALCFISCFIGLLCSCWWLCGLQRALVQM